MRDKGQIKLYGLPGINYRGRTFWKINNKGTRIFAEAAMKPLCDVRDCLNTPNLLEKKIYKMR